MTQRKCEKCGGYGWTRTPVAGAKAESCGSCTGSGWVELSKPQRRRGGAPGSLTEASTLVRGPALLLEAARTAAEAEGVDVAEWWRRAARERLDRLRASGRPPAPAPASS